MSPLSPESSAPLEPAGSELAADGAYLGDGVPEWVEDLRAEAELARENSIPWQFRGPSGPTPSDPYWRNQRWRPNSERWANRGGAKRDWYQKYYQALRNGLTKQAAREHADAHAVLE